MVKALFEVEACTEMKERKKKKTKNKAAKCFQYEYIYPPLARCCNFAQHKNLYFESQM